jgi:hypothetical protein
MLRIFEDYSDRRLPVRTLKTAAMILVTLAVATFSAGPASAHGGTEPATVVPPGYMPYANGMGDPLGVTLTRHGKATGTAVFVAHAAHAEVAGTNPLAAKVREANARFADVAVATAEGYAPIPCVSGVEGGAMGIHYVNGARIEDGVVDLGKPEAVMYEPKADGSLELVAVEYITTKGPAELDGHLFSFTNAPNRYGLPPFYELHVWAWRANPTGTFADMNPNVSCDAAVAAQQ